MTLKLLSFSDFGEVNVSQFASQFVSRISFDGALTGAPGDRLNAGPLVVGEDDTGRSASGSARNIATL